MPSQAASYSKYLAEWGWMGLFILACIAIVIMVVWWIKYERPRLAKVFKEKEEELKELINKYDIALKDQTDKHGKASKRQEAVLSKMAARLIDIAQLKEAMINANQRVIDQIAKGRYKVLIKEELEKVKSEQRNQNGMTLFLDDDEQ